MRIAINCHSILNRHYAGIGRYTHNLISSLSEIDHNNEYILYVQRGPFDWAKKIPTSPSPNFKIKVDWFKKGPDVVADFCDIFHAPSPGPLPAHKRHKLIVTVHDLIHKALSLTHTDTTVSTTDTFMEEILQKADKIICASFSTCDDLLKFYNVEPQKAVIIYQGVNRDIFRLLPPEELEKELFIGQKKIEKPFILFVGTIEPRKNLANTIRAFAILKQKGDFEGKLVVVGRKGWKTENIPALIHQCGLEQDIVFLGYVPDRELCYLYNTAEVFVFPSLYEGFGYPLVEAFCCGAAVVTSTVSSCPEIAGEAALMANPYDPRAIAQAMSRVIHNPDLKQQLKERGLLRCQKFSLRKTAMETLALYSQVIKER